MGNINKLIQNVGMKFILLGIICALAVMPVYSDPSNTSSDIKIYWTDFETLHFEIQVEDGSEHILIIKFRVLHCKHFVETREM